MSIERYRLPERVAFRGKEHLRPWEVGHLDQKRFEELIKMVNQGREIEWAGEKADGMGIDFFYRAKSGGSWVPLDLTTANPDILEKKWEKADRVGYVVVALARGDLKNAIQGSIFHREKILRELEQTIADQKNALAKEGKDFITREKIAEAH